MAYTTKYHGKKHKTVKDKEKSEDVKNFYVARAKVGRSDEEMYRNRRGDYGKKPHGTEGPLPIPITGMIVF